MAWGLLNIDVFAARLTFQLDQYVSWRPDASAVHADAFTLDWATVQGYAFPTFTVIGRCLQLVQSQRVLHYVTAIPVWPTQICYSLLPTLFIERPVDSPLDFPAFKRGISSSSTSTTLYQHMAGKPACGLYRSKRLTVKASFSFTNW